MVSLAKVRCRNCPWGAAASSLRIYGCGPVDLPVWVPQCGRPYGTGLGHVAESSDVLAGAAACYAVPIAAQRETERNCGGRVVPRHI